jgi:phosphatidate cytidylyltransferase
MNSPWTNPPSIFDLKAVDNPVVLWALASLFLILVVATIIVNYLHSRGGSGEFDEIVQRLRTWWIIVLLLSSAILLSSGASLVFFALISFLGLKEFLTLAPTRRVDRDVLFYIYLSIPVQYLWAALEWYGMFIIFVPVYLFLFVPLRMVLSGNTKNFLRAAGILHWGVMTTVFSISHLGFLLMLPATRNPYGDGPALVLYLIILTQLNDVAQYVWGKALGSRRVVPNVSPNKTWEGLVGGVATTTILATVLSPWMTPLNLWQGVIAGLGIGIFGFVGDVCVSAVKRDLGIKDTSQMLPGHGGVLDRVDSLTYTAPLFFHFVYYTCH